LTLNSDDFEKGRLKLLTFQTAFSLLKQ